MIALAALACPSSRPELPTFIAERVARYEAKTVRSEHSAHALLLGSAPVPGNLDLSTNDYLAIGRHRDVIEAQIAELRFSGNEQMMSSVLLDQSNPQWGLEKQFADFLSSDSCILFQSGYQANMSLLQTLVEPGDSVYLDQMAHASLYQGAAAAHGAIRSFRHNEPEHLRRQIETFGPGVVCVDSVYSTNGSVAPLASFVQVAEENGCVLVVDESHSLGSHGPAGAGLVVAHGLEERVHFRTASLAKAFCGRAGLVAAPGKYAYYLRFASFPNIFSSALLPHELAAFGKTLEIVRHDDWRRIRLHRNAALLRAGLDAIGYNVSASDSQIIALEPGREGKLVELTNALRSRGIFGSPFFAPATAKNKTCMRLSVHAGLSDENIARIVAVCDEIRDEVGLDEWPSSRRKGCRARALPVGRAPKGRRSGPRYAHTVLPYREEGADAGSSAARSPLFWQPPLVHSAPNDEPLLETQERFR